MCTDFNKFKSHVGIYFSFNENHSTDFESNLCPEYEQTEVSKILGIETVLDLLNSPMDLRVQRVYLLNPRNISFQQIQRFQSFKYRIHDSMKGN